MTQPDPRLVKASMLLSKQDGEIYCQSMGAHRIFST